MVDTDLAVSNYCDCWPPRKKLFDLAEKKEKREWRKEQKPNWAEEPCCCWHSSWRQIKESRDHGTSQCVLPSLFTQKQWEWEGLGAYVLQSKTRLEIIVWTLSTLLHCGVDHQPNSCHSSWLTSFSVLGKSHTCIVDADMSPINNTNNTGKPDMHMNARLLASNECASSGKGSKLRNNARL